MRKYLVIPILLCYTLSMCSIMVYAHYCCKYIVTVSLYPVGENCNGCSDCGKTANCCKDKVIKFKTVQDQHNIAPYKIKQVAVAYIVPAPLVFAPYATTVLGSKAPQHMPNAPPGLWQNIPLYKLHARLTYYG